MAQKKKPTVGTGGHGKKALAGKGPTPRAEDRTYHKAYKSKQAATRTAKKGEFVSRGRTTKKASEAGEVISGRNSVLEALRASIPAKSLMLATQIEMDDRIKESISIANQRGIPLAELTRAEIERMTGGDSVHQGIALSVPPYQYSHPSDLITKTGKKPLIVALDGITDPRNLGAIIRSAAAFGATGILLPQRRSVGMTAAAWKTSAGAAARMPVALAANLNQTLKDFKKQGLFIIGLDADGSVSSGNIKLADQPLVVVVGSEGKGLSRLVGENCDQIISIPIGSDVESLNAGIAASVVLYEISKARLRS